MLFVSILKTQERFIELPNKLTSDRRAESFGVSSGKSAESLSAEIEKRKNAWPKLEKNALAKSLHGASSEALPLAKRRLSLTPLTWSGRGAGDR
jgi:hypothetical protein